VTNNGAVPLPILTQYCSETFSYTIICFYETLLNFPLQFQNFLSLLIIYLPLLRLLYNRICFQVVLGGHVAVLLLKLLKIDKLKDEQLFVISTEVIELRTSRFTLSGCTDPVVI